MYLNNTFEAEHGIQFFLFKRIFLKRYEDDIYRVQQQSRKLKFSHEGLTRFQKFFSIWVAVKDWRAKLESAYF